MCIAKSTQSLILSLEAASALLNPAASAAVHDLVADWSYEENPNGAWSYNEREYPLPHVDWWQRTIGGWSEAQPAWADSEDGNDRLPVWFKSSGKETEFMGDLDWQEGDVVMHSWDPYNGAGNGEGNVTWACPGDGTIDIEGAIWLGREWRGNDWLLYLDDVELTHGRIEPGDEYSRENPMTFDLGSGGASVLQNVAVSAGDVLKLEVVKITIYGDFCGVKLTIRHCPTGCSADIDCDGVVDVLDLLILLSNWDCTGEPGECQGDLLPDGVVNVLDLIELLSVWGPCL